MRMLKLIGALVLTLAAVPASQAAELTAGEKELELSGSWSDTDEIGSIVDLDLLLGFMLTDHHEIGPVVSYLAADPDEDSSVVNDLFENDQGFAGAFYRYNFSGNGVTPYFGGSAAFPFGDVEDFVDWAVGVEAGLRVMPGERASVNFEVFYDRLILGEPPGGGPDLDDADQWGVAAGISIFF